MRIYAYSHIGNSRDNHEDNYFIGRGKYISPSLRCEMEQSRKCHMETLDINENDYLCCVCDGMGGHGYGEEASLFAVEYIDKHYNANNFNNNEIKEQIQKFIKDMNDSMLNTKSSITKYKDMGTTLCGIVCCNQSVLGINVGDSRIYQMHDNSLKQISVDNTEGQRLLDLGLLTSDEVLSFPNRKAIYKYLGKSVELVPDVYEIEQFSVGDLLILCSDGLSDVLEPGDIQEILNKEYISLEEKGRFLIEIALERKKSNGDNITLVIMENK